MLLSDEPIFVQDDNYFHTPATPLSPSQDPNNGSGGGGGDGEGYKDNGITGTNGAGVATGIAAVGVSSVNSPTTGKIISTYYFFTYVITCLMSISLV